MVREEGLDCTSFVIHDEHSDSTDCSHGTPCFSLYQNFVLFLFMFSPLDPGLPFASGVCTFIYRKGHCGQGWESQNTLSSTFVGPNLVCLSPHHAMESPYLP